MKTTLTGEAVAQAMRERHGRISDWEPLAEGEVSQAFAFRADGRDLVVRVGPRREGFDKDAWAARRMPAAVPVPEVLEVGALGEAYCCVSERMGGVHLETCGEAQRRQLAPAVRAVVDAIAAVDVSGSEGFGSFDPKTEHGPHATWAAHLRALLPEDWSGLGDAADIALAEELTAVAVEIAAGLPVARQPVHGDLNPRNFTVEGDRITGVFDWEAAVIGDPAWETARYLLWAPMLPSTRTQADHDLDHLAIEPERLRSLVIVNGLWALDFYRRQARTDAMELMLNRVHGFREEPPGLSERGYWMRLLKPGTR